MVSKAFQKRFKFILIQRSSKKCFSEDSFVSDNKFIQINEPTFFDTLFTPTIFLV